MKHILPNKIGFRWTQLATPLSISNNLCYDRISANVLEVLAEMKKLRKKYEALPEDAPARQIELTAESLERRHHDPMLLLKVPNFNRMTKSDMLAEFDRVVALPPDSRELKSVVAIDDPSQVAKKHLSSLLNQYLLLCNLRKGLASAWDVINELYEDD
ncbi:MAG: hypothetical protein PHR69_09515 [Sphaerochaeta sp.]|nr:hypothetical protein [Sphaerochaeta sp.]